MLNQLRRHIAKVIGRRVDIAPSEDAMNHYRSGVAASNAGRHEDALEEFTNAILVARVDSHMNHHRGRALAELGRHEEAIFDYDAAVRANPSYPDTYLEPGQRASRPRTSGDGPQGLLGGHQAAPRLWGVIRQSGRGSTSN